MAALDENQIMVTITDRNHNSKDLLSIFPPLNHENLHNPTSPDSPSTSTSCSSSLSTSSFSSSTSISLDSDDASLPPDSTSPADCINQYSPHQIDVRLQICNVSGWLRFGMEILRRKIFNSSFPGYNALVSVFRSFPLFTTLAGLYAASLVVKWLWMRRNRRYKINMLMDAVKEKDEKIVKLLDQIAQLNQVLLTRHKTH